MGLYLLADAGAADRAEAQLFFHQQPYPEERQAEDQKRKEDNPALHGDSLFSYGRVSALAVRASIAARRRARRAVRLHELRGMRGVSHTGCGRRVIAHLRACLLPLKHSPTVPTDARGFVVDSAAVIAGNHAGLYLSGLKNMRAERSLLKELAHHSATRAV